jgi:hypothetical protein
VHIADLTADGLPDLLVGRLNRVDGSGALTNGLTFFKNTGSASLAAFERVSNDYAGLSALGRQGLAPTTADLDGDGDLDLLVGDIGGNLHFYRNVAAAGMPAAFTLAEADFQGINLGVQAVPALYDLDRDGKPDLLLGERNGNLNYLRNIGTSTAPAFLLETEFWGAVDTRRAGFTVGSSAPFLRLNEGNQTELYVGSQSGYLYRYGNIDGNLLGTFDLVDSSWGGLLPGLKSSIALADFNGDTISDVLLGNIRGGLQLFTSKGVPPPVGLEPAALPNLQIWPNPASSVLYVRWPVGQESGYPWKLLNSSGQVMLEGEQGPDLALAVADLPRGLYFFAWTATPAIGAGGVPGIRSGSGVSGTYTSGRFVSGNSPVTCVIKIMLLP